MATHSSILAWKIPWTEESGGLQSMGPQKVRHNLASKQQLDIRQCASTGCTRKWEEMQRWTKVDKLRQFFASNPAGSASLLCLGLNSYNL